MPGWLLSTLGVPAILAAVVITVLTVLVVARIIFNRNANKQIKRLLSGTPQADRIICREDLSNLPQPVQRWLAKSNIIGQEQTTSVRLKQQGMMRTKKDGPWMKACAEQYFRADKPGFVWKASVAMAPLFRLSGLDNYQEGKGRMSIKILSLIPVVNAEGPEMDYSTLLRYLAEMPWFPSAALNPYIKWEPMNMNSARATMSWKGVIASGVFNFSDEGDIISFFTKRYRENNGKYSLCDWGGINKEFREFNGIRVPSKSEVIWRETTGDFKWFECEITDIEYNIPELY